MARWLDVVDTLSRNETFRVPYKPHMDTRRSVMLARDGAVENWRDKSVMRTLLRWEDVPAIRALATDTAAAALAAVPPPG